VDGRSRRASPPLEQFRQRFRSTRSARLDLANRLRGHEDNPLRPWRTVDRLVRRQSPKIVEHSIGVPEQQLLEVPLSDTPDRIVIQRR